MSGSVRPFESTRCDANSVFTSVDLPSPVWPGVRGISAPVLTDDHDVELEPALEELVLDLARDGWGQRCWRGGDGQHRLSLPHPPTASLTVETNVARRGDVVCRGGGVWLLYCCCCHCDGPRGCGDGGGERRRVKQAAVTVAAQDASVAHKEHSGSVHPTGRCWD